MVLTQISPYLGHNFLLQDAPCEVRHLESHEAEAKLQGLCPKSLVPRCGWGFGRSGGVSGGEVIVAVAIHTRHHQATHSS